jgi:hypothetical protein
MEACNYNSDATDDDESCITLDGVCETCSGETDGTGIVVDNDIDDDQFCDDEDDCPNDPDNDIDDDGICGDVDTCPNDADNDIDGDDVCGDIDVCPDISDDQSDTDGDGVGDACDDCVNNFDPYQNDGDGDGLADACADDDDDADGNVDCWNFAIGTYVPGEPWGTGVTYWDSDDNILTEDDILALIASGTCGDIWLAVDELILPEEFGLSQNYPNPFNPSTSISYEVASHGMVSVKIYDLTGKLISDLVNDFHLAGTYTTTWNAIDYNGLSVPSGLYIYQLRSNDIVHTKKMLLLR